MEPLMPLADTGGLAEHAHHPLAHGPEPIHLVHRVRLPAKKEGLVHELVR